MAAARNVAIFLLQSITVGLALAFVAVTIRPQLLSPPSAAGSGAGGPPLSYARAVTITAPSVVNIYTTRISERRGRPTDIPPGRSRFLQPRTPLEESLGSGVIVDPRGYIVTNRHVIRGALQISVALLDGRVADARQVGTDAWTDLALLQIDLPDLTPIRMGRSDTLETGDVVLAIGNSYGIGQTVTQGIVSATRRSPGLNIFESFIQTDASINPGNSGGALINARGELVGINSAILSGNRSEGSIGIGFAIPVNLTRGVVQQLIDNGRVIRGWLGFEPRDMTVELASVLPGVSGRSGVYIPDVLPNSPASTAGLRPGDVLTHLNGEAVRDSRDALGRVARAQPGDVVALRIIRNGRAVELEVPVAEQPLGPS